MMTMIQTMHMVKMVMRIGIMAQLDTLMTRSSDGNRDAIPLDITEASPEVTRRPVSSRAGLPAGATARHPHRLPWQRFARFRREAARGTFAGGGGWRL